MEGPKTLGTESTPPAAEGDATETRHEPGSVKETEGRVARFITGCDKYLCKLLGRQRVQIARERLSRRLESDYPLKVSKWLGSTTIGCFFIFLIAYLLIRNSGTDNWGIVIGLHKTAAHIKAAYLAPLFPRIAGGAWDAHALFNAVMDCVQLLFVSAAIATLFLLRNENHHGGPAAFAMGERVFGRNLRHTYPLAEGQKQLKKFKEYFLYFWCTTFLLYVILLLNHLQIGFCYNQAGSVLLVSKTLGQASACHGVPPQGSVALMLTVLPYPFLVFSLATVNLLFIFWCFVVLRSPAFDKRAIAKQKLLVNYSGFVVALIIALYPLLLFMRWKPGLAEPDMRNYAALFDGVTGTLSAVGLALLIARMDSKFFGLRSWLIGLLFAYASIQPLFVAFALNVAVLKTVQTAVLLAALGLKICFFLIVAHSLQSGRVLNHMVCFPFFKERVDSIFENQFEIRLARADGHLFTFSILKKNEPRYSTAIRFQTRAECDKFIHYLRERMQKREAYLPLPKGMKPDLPPCEESGTFWVELRDEGMKLICESIPLRSEEEVHDLISESINKIPYCRYNRA